MKRRVASLPPISSEIFAEKVLNAQASSSAVAAKASFERACAACQKSYYSENAYQNHLRSQKHRLRAAVLSKQDGIAVDDETSSVMSSTISLGEPISILPKAPQCEKPSESIDPEAEAEFSKVVDGIKNTQIIEAEPVSRRPTRPHHSANENRTEHPLSPPHKQASTGPDTTAQTDASPEENALNRCLFCNYNSPTFKLGIMHMTKYHGLFIPEQKFLVDLEALIAWLHNRIFELHECLYCHKTRGSTEAIQTHMRDVGHCMIAFETEEDMIEVGQFYDFRSTYSDAEDSDEDMEDNEADGGVKVDPRKILKTMVCDETGDQEMQNGAENGDGWETDSSASSLDSAELTAVPIEDHRDAYKRLPKSRHHSRDDRRPHHQVDGFHSHAHAHHAVFHSDHELHLPSGRTAGHRSLARYYRQNLHSYPTPSERMEQQRMIEAASPDIDQPMMDGSERGRQVLTRANGGQGMLGVTDAKRREVQAVEKMETRRAQRAQKQYQWGVDKRGNSQKHFRDPLLQ